MEWIESGTKFIIWNKNQLIEQLHRHLKTNNFNSFRRQLSLYGFKREKHISKKPLYFHPLFRQDREELLGLIGRAKQSNMKSKFEINYELISSIHLQIVINRQEDNAQLSSRKEFLEYIKDLDKYMGIGIIKFTKELILLLNKAFPGIARKLETKIFDTEQILYRPHFIKPAKIVNKKELLISLINTLLLTIKKEIRRNNKDLDTDKQNDEFKQSDCKIIHLSKYRSNDTNKVGWTLCNKKNASQEIKNIKRQSFSTNNSEKSYSTGALRKISHFQSWSC